MYTFKILCLFSVLVSNTDDHEMLTDRPIRQNEPAATTTHDTTPTEISKPG